MKTAKEISVLLANQAEDVARYLLPNGHRIGNEFCVGSITGESGNSLKVKVSGGKAGVFCEFADGTSGDLLDLWALVRNLSLSDALKEATSYLGITKPIFEAHRPLNYKKPIQRNFALPSSGSPVFNYLTQARKLTPETIAAFKVGEQRDTIVFNFLHDRELILVKYLEIARPDGKKQMRVEKDCEPVLFGWQAVNSNNRTIAITEGEIDAMSLHQYGISALSIPLGVNNDKWIANDYDHLAIFDEIFICMDNDEPGRKAALAFAERLGLHRCRIVELPKKDANECLQAGVSKEEIQAAFRNAKSFDPAELKRASLFVDEVIEEFYPSSDADTGLLSPWEKAKDKISFRPDELSIWCGVNGHGKSQFLGHIILHSMKQGAKVCIASLELKPKRLLMRLTRQAGAIANPSIDYIHAIHDWYGDKLWLFDLTGIAKAKRLLEVFKYARQRYGVTVFVIDSLLKLDIAEDDYKAQKTFINALCDFKNEHNCHIHLITHPRKGMDEHSTPGKLDIKGTGAISDLADNCFTIWRNKRKEEAQRLQANGFPLEPKQLSELESPDCLWICDKQRNGDWEGKIALWFDVASFQYLNHATQKPVSYVNYSKLNSLQNADYMQGLHNG